MDPQYKYAGRYEGSWRHNMIELIQRMGYNPGWKPEIVFVSSVNPLIFKNPRDGFEYATDEIMINKDLLPKTETVIIDGVSRTLTYPNEIKVGEEFLMFLNYDSPYGEACVVMRV
ncbi:hypothetical protein D0469_03555 [Peribacillus saganii]|uniref:Uncharacterized protein n=1 Tax=Peribacillus saganii TaxID=2303992 RepID=A0A372LS58_9BACI|nr:hypothetical protein [Peribacillus saganii]RFU71029.1 hypothetical protein D0469_03555 [Peribacillus saganii]